MKPSTVQKSLGAWSSSSYQRAYIFTWHWHFSQWKITRSELCFWKADAHLGCLLGSHLGDMWGLVFRSAGCLQLQQLLEPSANALDMGVWPPKMEASKLADWLGKAGLSFLPICDMRLLYEGLLEKCLLGMEIFVFQHQHPGPFHKLEVSICKLIEVQVLKALLNIETQLCVVHLTFGKVWQLLPSNRISSLPFCSPSITKLNIFFLLDMLLPFWEKLGCLTLHEINVVCRGQEMALNFTLIICNTHIHHARSVQVRFPRGDYVNLLNAHPGLAQ